MPSQSLIQHVEGRGPVNSISLIAYSWLHQAGWRHRRLTVTSNYRQEDYCSLQQNLLTLQRAARFTDVHWMRTGMWRHLCQWCDRFINTVLIHHNWLQNEAKLSLGIAIGDCCWIASLAVLEMRSKRIGVKSLTFLGHVTSWVTWPFDSP